MVVFEIDMADDTAKHETPAAEQLAAIAAEISGCRKCPLAETRTNTVPGEGSTTAEIMFVGEGPGKDEDLSGRPFVGRAGKLLDQLIEALPMRREDVYIANVVKCRPPNNRDPERREVAQCSDYLYRQIDAVDPLVIVPLGRHALEWFEPKRRITASNGKVLRHGNRVLMPLLHPSAGLRSTENARMLREGIHNLRDAMLEGIRVRRDAATSSVDTLSDTSATAEGPIESQPETPTVNAGRASEAAVAASSNEEEMEKSNILFDRPQTHDEARAEMKKLLAAEEAQNAVANDAAPVRVDENQASFF